MKIRENFNRIKANTKVKIMVEQFLKMQSKKNNVNKTSAIPIIDDGKGCVELQKAQLLITAENKAKNSCQCRARAHVRANYLLLSHAHSPRTD